MPENLFSLASHCFVWGSLLLSTGCSVMQGNLMSSNFLSEASRSTTREPPTATGSNSGYVFFNGTKNFAATTSESAPPPLNPAPSAPVARQVAQQPTPPFPRRLAEPERLRTAPVAASSLTRKLIQTNSRTDATLTDADAEANVGRVRFDGVLPADDIAGTESAMTNAPVPTTTRPTTTRPTTTGSAATGREPVAGDPAAVDTSWKESRTAEWKRVAARKGTMTGPSESHVVQVSGRRPPLHRPMTSAARPGHPVAQMVPQPVPMPCPEGLSNPCDCDPCQAATVHGDQISALFKRVETMETDLKHSHQSISTLEKSLTVANSEIVRLKKDVDYWQTELNRLEASVQQQHHDDIEALGRVSEMLGLLIENADMGAGNDFTADSGAPGGDTGLTITSDAALEFATGNPGGAQ